MLLLMLTPAVLCALLFTRAGAVDGARRLRGKSLLILAAALQFVQVEGWWEGVVPVDVERRIYGLGVTVIAIVFCWLNRDLTWRRTGRFALILLPIGAALNAIPMIVIGAMPYSASSAVAAGYSVADAYGPIPGYVRLDQTSLLWTPVADVVPIPILEKVISLGDIALLGGAILLVLAICTSGRFDGRIPDNAAMQSPPQTGDASPDTTPTHIGKEDR